MHATLHQTPRGWSRSFLNTASHTTDATCQPKDCPPLFEPPGRCSAALLGAYIVSLVAIKGVAGRAPGNRGLCWQTELALRPQVLRAGSTPAPVDPLACLLQEAQRRHFELVTWSTECL